MENNTKTIERIAYFVEKKGISLNSFSQRLGVSNSYFSKMIKNKASVGSNIIENILRIYPDLNTRWLLTGEGNMLNTKEPAKESLTSDLPTGPCQQCEQRERVIASQAKTIALLEDKIESLEKVGHNESNDRSNDYRQTG